MRKWMIIAMLLIFSMCGSKKYGDAYVKGIVTEIGSGKVFPNVKVYLVKMKDNQKDGTLVIKNIIDSTATDGNGNYHIAYDKEKGNTYLIKIKVNGRYGTGNAIRPVTLYEKNETQNFELDPTAYLKLHLKKTSTAENSVLLQFDSGSILSFPAFKVGIDTVLPPVKVIGNYKMDQFYWRAVDPKNPSTAHPDVLFINAGDTLLYPITY